MAKTVLISGGTKGLGKGAALTLLKDGFNVVAFSRDQKNCDALSAELGKNFNSKQFLVLNSDVTNEVSLAKVVQETVKRFKTIDILINNAGFGYFVEADNVDIKTFQDMIQTNLVGVARLTKLVVPYMKRQKSGLIINLVSSSGKTAFAQGEFYSATKFGLMGYSEGLRNELREFGIKVATVCPGMVKTDFFGEKELERRKKLGNGKIPSMLAIEDVNRVISLICNQSQHCEIRDVYLVAFD